MASSERRSRKERGYDKSATKRPKRGVNINDIEKLGSRTFKIIDLDNKNFKDKLLSDIPTKEDKSIQKHQTTRTLHKKCDISVPDFKPIRHELPNKSLNPSLKSTNHKPFTLPNHYIQYVSCRDKGYVSFKDFYHLKHQDIQWLIHEISNKSLSGYNLIDNINKKYSLSTLIQSQQSQLPQNKKETSLDKKATPTCTPTPFMMSIDSQTSLFSKNITPPPNGIQFPFNSMSSMHRDNSMSPPINREYNHFESSFYNNINYNSIIEDINKEEKKKEHNMDDCGDNIIRISNTNLTRLSLSKLIYFLEYKMYRIAKYKSNPLRYFPLNQVLISVRNWDPSYESIDVQKIYFHWIKTRRNNGRMSEKSLIRNFQQPPDTNDDDSNIAFRPRVCDERHVTTRRQTKKPKTNTKEAYIQLQVFLHTIQKQYIFWKKQLEIEQYKKQMILKNIKDTQHVLQNNQYIKDKLYIIDSMNRPNIKYNQLFNTFSSKILATATMSLSNNNNNIVALTKHNMDTYNNNFKDISPYKKVWKSVCNGIIVPKTNVIIDKIQEFANNIKSLETDIVCNKMGITLNQLNIHKSINNKYHWEIKPNSRPNNDNDNDIDIDYKRYNTIKHRLLHSMSYINYKKDNNILDEVNAVSIPSISRNGELQIKTYHPLIKHIDDIQQPQHQKQPKQTNTMFDQFTVPIQPIITHYNANKNDNNTPKKIKSLIINNRNININNNHNHNHNHNKMSGRKRKSYYDPSSSLTLSPAPKRQKLIKTQSLSELTRQKKKLPHIQHIPANGLSLKKFPKTSNLYEMQSMLEQNKHKQQYIQLQQKSHFQKLKNKPTLKPIKNMNNKPNKTNNKNTISPPSFSQTMTPMHARTLSANAHTAKSNTKTTKTKTKTTTTTTHSKTNNSSNSKKKKKDKSKKKKDKSKEDKKSKKKDKSKKKSSTKKKNSKSSQKNTITTYLGFGAGHKKKKKNDDVNLNTNRLPTPTPDSSNNATQDIVITPLPMNVKFDPNLMPTKFRMNMAANSNHTPPTHPPTPPTKCNNNNNNATPVIALPPNTNVPTNSVPTIPKLPQLPQSTRTTQAPPPPPPQTAAAAAVGQHHYNSNTNNVPPPPSAIGYNNGGNTMSRRQQRHSIPSFGATPSINQSSQSHSTAVGVGGVDGGGTGTGIGGDRNTNRNTKSNSNRNTNRNANPNRNTSHSMSYRQQHRNTNANPLHSLSASIPLSPTMQQRTNRGPIHQNLQHTTNRNKRSNSKPEIIELDK